MNTNVHAQILPHTGNAGRNGNGMAAIKLLSALLTNSQVTIVICNLVCCSDLKKRARQRQTENIIRNGREKDVGGGGHASSSYLPRKEARALAPCILLQPLYMW
jgi:hypothetical protein